MLIIKAHDISQSIIGRSLTMEARVPTLYTPSEICGGRIDSGSVLLHVHSVSSPISIPQMLHSLHDLRAALT